MSNQIKLCAFSDQPSTGRGARSLRGVLLDRRRELMGFLGVTRRFASKEDLTSALIMAGISLAHYGRAVATVDRAPGEIRHFSVGFSDVEKLSLIQPDA